MLHRWSFALWCLLLVTLLGAGAAQAEFPQVTTVDLQPLQAQAKRVAAALAEVGQPLAETQQKKLDEALASADAAVSIKAIQEVFDPLCLAGVTINAESRVKVESGPAPRRLVQHGWTVFLVKVHNEAGVTAALKCTSPNADPLHTRSKASPEPETTIKPADVVQRWTDVAVFNRQPLNETLSGLPLEYVLLEVYSRDAGQREAKLVFDVGQGTQDLAFRNELNALFNCDAAVAVKLDVLDYDGKPTMGQFLIRDLRQRVYPSRARRLAPDFFFHDQIYRASGETVSLPPGKYEFTFTRGPEYNIERREVIVPAVATHQENFRLNRWINLAEMGWFSGDHHVHAAGCGHYESPTQGVEPADMMRHILGEDLNVGCVLSWGPCWYYQKQFFEGKAHALSTDRYIMRYDIEVSGFPSSHAGHLTLLRLKDDDYPGTKRLEEWPSWDLPILAWGKEQGGVVGFSHSGWGLKVDATSLPTFEMPPFDSIGANEYIVDVTHDVCDFISTVDTPAVWELSIWYHTLNCGYTCRISGETDFPCIYGERVGLGRSYIKLPKDQPLDFDNWVSGLKDGRSYVSDGLSHLVDFKVNQLGVGEPGDKGRPSVLALKSGEKLTATARVAAMLEPQPREEIRQKPLDQKPYWHVERARIESSRKVPVELIVNGVAVERKEIEADGKLSDVTFEYQPTQSSWVALRIFPSSHTNPVFVEVEGAPIRASKKSAQWCLDAVDVCWKQKEGRIRETEKAAAAAAYEASRAAYRKILAAAKED